MRRQLLMGFFLTTFLIFGLINGISSVWGMNENESLNETSSNDLSVETRLLRYPDLFGDEVVFTYAGDIWKASVKGGNATRLTAHEGQEMFAKFSPDGKWIAFTGQYDGDEQVYVIPSNGGVPKQLTFYPISGPNPPRRGFDHQVLGWTPDSQQILFRSGRDSNGIDALTNLYLININGGLPEKLPIPVAGAGDLSPDGKQIVYSPLFRDFRHWKRYEGGWAQYLMIFNRESNEFQKIPTTPRTDRDPMFVGDSIYFVSDRDGTMNLYRFHAENNEIEQLTDYNDWDIRWASSDAKDRIVYELAGQLYIYDTNKKTETKIPITVPHDGLAMRPSRINVEDQIESIELSPQGKRALVVARGDIFTVPAEKGNTRNLTKSSGAHERNAVWSKDGKWIAFISDKSGEEQIYLIDQTGNQDAIQLTDSFVFRLNDLQWSPDGKALSVNDARNHLWVIELETNEETGIPQAKPPQEIAKDFNGGNPVGVWSPCGNYLAFSLQTEVGYGSIYIWDKTTRQTVQITDEMFDNHSPLWSADGDWLYFIGQRDFSPQISLIEWNFAGNRFNSLFAVALRKDVKNIFAPQSDEVEIESDEEVKKSEVKKSEVENAETEKSESETTESQESEKKEERKPIEFEGIQQRVVRLPVSSENYENLAAAGDFLYYMSSPAPFYGRDSYAKVKLQSFDLKKQEEATFLDNVSGFAISPDATKILIQQDEGLNLYDIAATSGEATPISTSNLFVDRNPQEEWNEIFEEVWRRFRDYFYVRNMHGLDWKAIGDQYRELLPFVAHRSDLTYILTEMISELNIGHCYIEGGDYIVPQRPTSGLAGVLFELDKDANRYKIAKIYEGQNEESKYRSPLTELGVDVSEGDYLFEIDGEELWGNDNPYRLLQNKENAVSWKVGKKADGSDAHIITYQPIANEARLRYLNAVLERMRRVKEASDGRIGYFHVPDMGANGVYEFIKWYYPQIRKEGIIIDDRNNGGGNISPWMIMRLNQKLLGTRFGSQRETPTTYPTIACNAHLLCLINETSASDGDIFPYYFRKSGLGDLIGKRTWGGVVGYSLTGPLTDGGNVVVPLSATNDEKGEYIIEGFGVEPDIEVEQDPTSMRMGIDSQLERGIEEMLKKINEEPRRVLPKRPDDPDKSKQNVSKY
ncbi:MAG: S41 family peptidase [Planctomycetia bacterium]|nr:S41 family peptidase [Planctomycetia bacterium]